MEQFKYLWVENEIICIPVRGGEYFDENAEKKRQHHVSVDESHYLILCKQY